MTPAKYAMLSALQHAYGGEAIFRPSASARWMACPGSVQLLASVPKNVRNTAGAAAREGSGAHALAEIVLNSRTAPTGRQSPEDYIGRKVAINGARADDLQSDPNDFILVDEEMAEKIGEYISIVDSYLVTPKTELFVERKLTLAHLDPTDPLLAECRGTADVLALNRVFGWVVDLDLKYGKGVPVSRNASSVKLYALMAMLEFHNPERPWEWVGTTVFQPRLPYPQYSEDDWLKPFNYRPNELLTDFLPDVVAAMEAALEPDPPFNPSESACTWCAARQGGYCVAFQKAALAIGYDPFDYRLKQAMTLGAVPDFILPEPGLPAPAPREDLVVLPEIAGMTPEQVSRILAGKGMLALWLKGVEHRAVQLLACGVAVPGYRLKPRSGHRIFVKSPSEVVAALTVEGLAVRDLYEPAKLKSPSKIEKLLRGKQKALMHPGGGLVEKPVGDLQLVSSGGEPVDMLGPVMLEESLSEAAE